MNDESRIREIERQPTAEERAAEPGRDGGGEEGEEDLLQKPSTEQDWTLPKGGRSRRKRLLWATMAAFLLLALAYLTGFIGDRNAQRTPETVVEGPPPVVSATGPVVPERHTSLSFTTSGRVKTLAVRPGDQVKPGQLLAQLEPSTVPVSPSGTDSPLAGNSDLYIMAPFEATVAAVPVNEWETVAAGAPVIILGDLRHLRVEIEDLSEADVGRLEEGQSASITFEAFPGKTVSGRVARISPMNNARGGGVNYDVVVEFTDPDVPPLRWGMTAHVDVRVGEGH